MPQVKVPIKYISKFTLILINSLFSKNVTYFYHLILLVEALVYGQTRTFLTD